MLKSVSILWLLWLSSRYVFSSIRYSPSSISCPVAVSAHCCYMANYLPPPHSYLGRLYPHIAHFHSLVLLPKGIPPLNITHPVVGIPKPHIVLLSILFSSVCCLNSPFRPQCGNGDVGVFHFPLRSSSKIHRSCAPPALPAHSEILIGDAYSFPAICQMCFACVSPSKGYTYALFYYCRLPFKSFFVSYLSTRIAVSLYVLYLILFSCRFVFAFLASGILWILFPVLEMIRNPASFAICFAYRSRLFFCFYYFYHFVPFPSPLIKCYSRSSLLFRYYAEISVTHL